MRMERANEKKGSKPKITLVKGFIRERENTKRRKRKLVCRGPRPINVLEGRNQFKDEQKIKTIGGATTHLQQHGRHSNKEKNV